MSDKNKNKSNKTSIIENYKFRINWIKNYIDKNSDEYFNYFSKECKRKEDKKHLWWKVKKKKINIKKSGILLVIVLS